MYCSKHSLASVVLIMLCFNLRCRKQIYFGVIFLSFYLVCMRTPANRSRGQCQRKATLPSCRYSYHSRLTRTPTSSDSTNLSVDVIQSKRPQHRLGLIRRQSGRHHTWSGDCCRCTSARCIGDVGSAVEVQERGALCWRSTGTSTAATCNRRGTYGRNSPASDSKRTRHNGHVGTHRTGVKAPRSNPSPSFVGCEEGRPMRMNFRTSNQRGRKIRIVRLINALPRTNRTILVNGWSAGAWLDLPKYR